jgi:hypothetical protein
MTEWMYEYKRLISEIDRLQKNQGTKQSKAVWTGVKSRMRRIADDLVRQGVLKREEAISTVWYAFEERMSTDDPPPEEEYVTRVDEAMWDYVLSAPSGREGEWAYWMEIAFAQARDFSRKEAIDQQEQFLEEEGGYHAVYGQPRPKPKLRLVKGAK